MTDWMAARLIRLDWVEQLDLGNMPNVTANLQDVYKNVTWDPTNDHHVPWQSGMTGLGYDKAKTGDLTSLDALWDTKYKGKVDYLTEMRDAIGLTMLKLGLDPSKATKADCDAAVAEIQKAKDAGIIRAFKGNAYAEDLKSGDVVLSMAWSGDMVQALADKPTPRVHDRRPGRDAVDRQLHDPEGGQERLHGAGHDRLLLRPRRSRRRSRRTSTTSARSRGRPRCSSPTTRTWPTTR